MYAIRSYYELSTKVSELYSSFHYFHMTHSAYLKENDPNYDPEYDMLYVHRITSYNVCYTKLLRVTVGNHLFGQP